MGLNQTEKNAVEGGLEDALKQLEEKGVGSDVPQGEDIEVKEGEAGTLRNPATVDGDIRQRAKRAAEENIKKDKKKGKRMNKKNQNDRPKREACPVDGSLKLVGREIETDNGPKFVQFLTCKGCNDLFKKEQGKSTKSNADAALEAVLAGKDSVEVEDSAPSDKFSWVLSKIDLEKFEAEKDEAEEAYREVYEERVLAPLKALGHVDAFEWSGESGTYPRVRYTSEAFQSGEGQRTEKDLKSREEVRKPFANMRRLQERLKVAPRVKADLEAKLSEDNSADETSADNEDSSSEEE